MYSEIRRKPVTQYSVHVGVGDPSKLLFIAVEISDMKIASAMLNGKQSFNSMTD